MAGIRSNGRPEAEVIVNFLDGQSYSKGKVDEAFRALHLDKPYPKPPKAPPSPFKGRTSSSLMLSEAKGNVTGALRSALGL
ncbi:hypothetical protein BD414DRAFT_485284 [Trametes punicea]|nr:hypothetical protein BD414DRAFT_485284 [Trametes punicea]